MPTYTYRVLSTDGTVRTGRNRAGSPSELERRLRKDGVHPLEVSIASGTIEVPCALGVIE